MPQSHHVKADELLARASRSPPRVLGVKQEAPMTELYVFRGTTGHAEMVTDDKSGKKLPPHSFGEWVFSRTINVAGETLLIGDANCAQVLANVAKDGFHHWPELESDFAPATPPVRPPTLPPDFPDIAQNPSSELQPAPDPSATPDKVAGTMPAAARTRNSRQPRSAPQKPRRALPMSRRDIPL
jgi:hypothetical protein